MPGMSRYYLTRALIALLLGVAVGLSMTNWWLGGLAGLATFAAFLWIPRSGRYVVQDQASAAPMRADEMSRAIRDRAARNSFVAVSLYLSALVIHFGLVAQADVPVELLNLALSLALAVYVASDWLLRR
jgi:hypothetical protein